jgi:hypothetical protein
MYFQMATTPKKTSKVKTKTADSPVSSGPDAAKSAKPESPAKADAAGAAAPDGAGAGKKAAAPARPISYFSAVASEEYRAGWDNIFGRDKNKKAAKPAKPAAAKRPSGLPLTLTLDADDLDEATCAAVEAVLRRHAKKKRLNFDKLAKNGQVSWQLSCRISSA